MGFISKLLKGKNKVKIDNSKSEIKAAGVQFIDRLKESKPIVIDTESEEEPEHTHKNRDEVLWDIYNGAINKDFTAPQKENKNITAKNKNVTIKEDHYPQK